MRRGSDIPWQRRGVTCWNCGQSENYWASQILGPFGSPQGGILPRKRFFFYCAILGRLDITQKWFEVWLTATSSTQSKGTGLSSQETHSLTLFVMADSPLHSKEKRWVVKGPVWHFFSPFPFGFEVCVSHVSAVFWGHQAEPKPQRREICLSQSPVYVTRASFPTQLTLAGTAHT